MKIDFLDIKYLKSIFYMQCICMPSTYHFDTNKIFTNRPKVFMKFTDQYYNKGIKMKTNLQMIKTQIENATVKNADKIEKLQEKAFKLFEKQMQSKTNQKILKSIVNAVENSNDLTNVDNDDFLHHYSRVDFSQLIDNKDEFSKDLLKRYLFEYYTINTDFKNDCVTLSIGPSLIVNEDGEVFDQDTQKWIMDKFQNNTQEELITKIKEYQEKTGHYSSVIKVDHYGNANYFKMP